MPPQPIALANGQPLRLSLSRWTDIGNRGTIEVCSCTEDDSHVLTLVLRRGKSELLIGGRSAWKGGWAADDMLMTGPKSGHWRGIVHGGFDHLRIFFPQALVAECYGAVFGRAPAAPLSLFETDRVQDKSLRYLARVFRQVETYDDIIGPCFVDSLGLAFVSRLLAFHFGARIPGGNGGTEALAKPRLQRVIAYIEAHISRPVYLAELSEAAGLSRMHFVMQFKAATGYSPYAYVLNRRIAQAQALLRRPGATIVDVALDLGFSSQGHFTEAFRKVAGVTPGQWRRMQESAARPAAPLRAIRQSGR